MARRLLVLGAGPAQLGLLRAARARGLEVIVCDRDPLAPGFALADRRAIVSTEDEEGVDRLARAYEVDGLVSPGADWPVAIAARVAERLGLPHPLVPEVAALTVSKLRQRERFAAAGVPHAPGVRATNPAAALEAAAELGYPVVVKAPDRQGQRGLSYVPAEDELPAAAAAAIAASRSRSCLVERHVPGPEVTVNGFVVAGRLEPVAVTDRLRAEPPAFGVALAHVWPAVVPGAGGAIPVAAAAARAIGIGAGPVYAQLVVGPDGPVVVELAARLGGGHDAELCRLATGVDLNGLAIAAALGEEPSSASPQHGEGGACVRFLVAPEGELVEVTGVDEARRLPGVADVLCYRSAGHRFGPLRTGADRAGAVLATGPSPDEAIARAGAAAELIGFRVR